MSLRRSSGSAAVISAFVTIILVVTAALAVANKQLVIDQITVWQYKPSSKITNLSVRTGMNGYGKFLYYASQPKLDGTQLFNSECNLKENATAVLGCYTNGHIYIYDVTDPQLDGIREVTAAHETMHAAYERLSGSEKIKVDGMIEAEYEKIKNNPDIVSAMEYYAKNEPSEKDNELHSIIATEIKDLPIDLENYYGKYFSNRQKVVNLYANYIDVFNKLSNQAKAIAAQMDTLSSDITAKTAQYNTDVANLNVDVETFNQRANSGNMSSYQFYTERAALINRSNMIEAMRNNINSEINTYSQLLDQYNSLAAQSKKLYNSINSTLAPVSTISS